MNDHDEQIISDGIDFLRSLFDFTKRTPKHAYPISSLPYPKDEMKRVIKKYIVAFSQHQLDRSLQQAFELRLIKGWYLMLADFMDDADAELVNRVWDVYSTSGNNLGEGVEIISETGGNPQSTEDQKIYDRAIRQAALERDVMGREINNLVPMLNSINMLQTV